MDTTKLLLILLPFALLVASFGLFAPLVRRSGFRPIGEGAGGDGSGERWPTRRPWWGNPLTWLGVSVAFVMLGVYVAPRLFGGIVLLLPFVWIARSGRRSPRSKGGPRSSE